MSKGLTRGKIESTEFLFGRLLFEKRRLPKSRRYG